MFSCVFVTFPYGVLGQVWYSIVSIPDICLLPYLLTRALVIIHVYFIRNSGNVFPKQQYFRATMIRKSNEFTREINTERGIL